MADIIDNKYLYAIEVSSEDGEYTYTIKLPEHAQKTFDKRDVRYMEVMRDRAERNVEKNSDSLRFLFGSALVDDEVAVNLTSLNKIVGSFSTIKDQIKEYFTDLQEYTIYNRILEMWAIEDLQKEDEENGEIEDPGTNTDPIENTDPNSGGDPGVENSTDPENNSNPENTNYPESNPENNSDPENTEGNEGNGSSEP